MDIRTLDEATSAATSAARSYAATNSTRERTEFLRALAEAAVDARMHFTTRDGEPDILGRTASYRAWMSQVMGSAEIADGARASILASVRYHVSNVVRDRFDAETLTRHGLKEESARERGEAAARQRNADLALLTGTSAVRDSESARLLVRAISHSLSRVTIESATLSERAEIAALLAGIAADAHRAAARVSA